MDGQEEQVDRVQIIKDSRKILKDLANSTSILRLYLREPDKNRHGSTIPVEKDRIIKVLAEIHYDPNDSCPHLKIPKSRATRDNSLTFVEIAPRSLDQRLDYFWHIFNGQNNPDIPLITSIGGDSYDMSISLSTGVNYKLFYRLRDKEEKPRNLIGEYEKFMDNAQDFNLSEFGWGDY